MKKLIMSSAFLFLLHGFTMAQKSSTTLPNQNVSKPAAKKSLNNKPQVVKKQQTVALQQDVKLPIPDLAVHVSDSTAMPPAKKTE